METRIMELEKQIMDEIWPTMQAWGCKAPSEITLWDGPWTGLRYDDPGPTLVRKVEGSKFSVYFENGKITGMGKKL